MSADYKGSQAFAHIITTEDESVNPNTGSLNFVTPLVQLKGVRSSIDLVLRLRYSEGTLGTFGLPNDWGLDLPFVAIGTKESTVTTQGRTYVIDFDWIDDVGYSSGLRYLNNHGIKFEQVIPPQPLPSRQPGEYSYKLKTLDGSSDYFDGAGKLLEHDDIYGRYTSYSYNSGPEAGPHANELQISSILDSWDQTIQFSYQTGSEMQIHLPDGGTVVVSFSDAGVASIVDPAGQTTSFEYAQAGSSEILSTITYPTGLSSTFQYAQLDYFDENGDRKYMPAIQDNVYRDSDGGFLKHTSYAYGSRSGNTYTGAAIGLKLLPGRDTLMDSTGDTTTYRYDVTKTDLDENENELAQSYTWFDNLHLPHEETRMALINQGEFVEAYKSVFEYSIDPTTRARTINYDRPVCVELLNNITPGTETPSYQSMKRTNSTYNEFGNVVSVVEEMYVSSTGYVKQSTTQNAYSTTLFATQILTSATNTDEVTHSVYTTQNVPTSDERNIESTSISYQAGLEQPLQPWKQRSFTYDTEGRKLTEILTWSSGAIIPNGSVSSVTYTTRYQYSGGILTQTNIDPTNNATNLQYDVRKALGPMVAKILPLGQSETYQYDGIGRIVQYTDALGNQTSTSYSVGAAGNWEKQTTPLGYVKLTTSDALNRVIEVADNADPTQPPTSDPSRILTHKVYDTLSRLEKSTDQFGLTTTYTYDALGRPLTVTDPQQNVLSYQYDDTTLHATQRMNGDLRSLETMNGRQQIASRVKYADSGDTSINYCLEEDFMYDGSKRNVTTTLVQKQKSGDGSGTVLQTETVQYGPESSVLSRTTSGLGDAGQDTVARHFTYDLFGNQYTYMKQMTYANGQSFQHSGAVDIYDPNNRLATNRNQLGGRELWTYSPNGWLTTHVRLDGSTITYSYDNAGQITETVYPSETTTFTYDTGGRRTHIQTGRDVIKYQYSLDGTVTNIVYPDGSAQAYTLDKSSRIVTNIDAFGVARSTQFNQYAQISTQTCLGDTTTYMYGTANHTSGLLLGSSLSGSRNHHNQMWYDGLGRLKRKSVTDSSSNILLGTMYSIDGRGKIQSFISTSAAASDLNDTRTFSYDGMGQVISDTKSLGNATSVTKHTYDGNANVTATTVDNHTTTMTYNAIDQRTDSGFEYDTNGRMVRDGVGQQYSFDDRDRLVAVQVDSNTTNKLAYYPDDYLANFAGEKESAQMYYDAQKINAMQVTSENQSHKASVFRDSTSLTANYTDGSPKTYFLDRLGSSALLLEQDSQTSVTYSTYGEAAISSTIDIQSSFGLTQEFFDQSSSLVYLRSRYYNPKLMAFISMDTYRQENRYAYCQGDPVNLVDPSGHISERNAIAFAAAAAVGALVGFGVGALAAPALVFLGVSAETASIAAGIMGGAAASVASGATGAVIRGESYTLRQATVDALVGAAGSAASAYVGQLAGRLVAEGTIRTVVSGAAGSAAGSATQAFVRPVLTGERVSASDIAMSAITGALLGAAKAYGVVQKQRLSPQAMSMLRQLAGREPNEPNAGSVELTSMSRAGSLTLNNAADASLDLGVSAVSRSQPLMSDITRACNNALGMMWVDRGSPSGASAPLLFAHNEL
ncbi:MAG: hypothetical protein M1833_003029 [Piccolia ochrophora]|nr:MAG: hypothetical protein M1833_003029 [Piccolia ochrophora]